MGRASIAGKAIRIAKNFLSKSVKTFKFGSRWLSTKNAKWKLGSWFLKGLDAATWAWFLWDMGSAVLGDGDNGDGMALPPIPRSILAALCLDDSSDTVLQQAFAKAGAQSASSEDDGRALMYFAAADYLRSSQSVGDLMYSDLDVSNVLKQNADMLKEAGLVPSDFDGMSEEDVRELAEHPLSRKVMDYMVHFVELAAELHKEEK